VGALNVTDMLRPTQDCDIKRRLEATLANPRKDLETGKRWNLEIEEDEIRAACFASLLAILQLPDGSRSIRGVYDVAGDSALLQRPAKEKGVVFRVLDQENEWAC
jgi:hypothetical protein